MNLEISGSRPPSARSGSTRNPITGTFPTTVPSSSKPLKQRGQNSQAQSRGNSRPDGVPGLNLLAVCEKDDDDYRPLELDPYHYKLDTPNTSSTVSWGTPSTTYRNQLEQKSTRNKHTKESPLPLGKPDMKTKTKTAWDEPAVPENLPPPPEHMKKLYKQYEDDIKISCQKNNKSCGEEEINATIAELKLNLDDPSVQFDDSEDIHTHVNRMWTKQRYTNAQLSKRGDREYLEDQKMKNKLIETVMIDQLSRGVISDPSQDHIQSSRYSVTPGRRGANRSLHHSQVSTSSCSTEELLSKRVRFDARILSSHDSDATRALMGFFFIIDNSLTIYEYRQFGKSHKALPFINRDVYKHCKGLRKGQSYQLLDLFVGATLDFSTTSQPLPGSLMAQKLVSFRIVDLDYDCYDKYVRDLKLNPESYITKDERKRLNLFKEVQELVCKQISQRGVIVFLGVGRQLRAAYESGRGDESRGRHGVLNIYDLEQAFIDYHIAIPQTMFEDVCEVLDEESTSFLNYKEFMWAFLGEMREHRKVLVRKAFHKMDCTHKGYITYGDVRKFYNTRTHPKVQIGECSEEQVLADFMRCFQNQRPGTGSKPRWHEDDRIQYTEFEEYYEGVSVGMSSDQDFTHMLINVWGV